MGKRSQLRAAIFQVLRRLWPKSILGRIGIVALTGAAVGISVPVLLFAMIVANQIAGSFWGAVNIFNSPSSPPAVSQMVGVYHLKPESAEFIAQLSSVPVQPSTIQLYPDRTVQLRKVYEYAASGLDESGTLCRISGQGLWDITGSGGVEVVVHIQTGTEIQGGTPCGKTAWLTYAVLGRGRSHRLWSYIGDPDSDTGLEYAP